MAQLALQRHGVFAVAKSSFLFVAGQGGAPQLTARLNGDH